MNPLSSTHHLEHETVAGPDKKQLPVASGERRRAISSNNTTPEEIMYQTRPEELSAGALASSEEVRRLQLLSVQEEGNLWGLSARRGPSMPLGLARKELKQQNMHIVTPRRRHKKEFFQRLKLQDQVLQLQHQLEVQRQNCLQFHKLQMRLHADQAMLEQVQEENQCLNQQVASLTAVFMALQKMEVQDLAKKEALKDVQENHVFLESEIKSPRDVSGGGNSTEMTSSQLSSELSVRGSITSSSTADGSMYSSDMSFVGLSHPASVMGTTEMPSLARSSGLTQASQRRAIAQPKDDIEIPNWNSALSRNLSLSMMVSGQLQDCFSPLFTDSGKIAWSLGYMDNHGRSHSAYEDYQESASSAIGNLKIAEVDPGGRFVKILNCAPEKEESIGDYLLKQDIQGQPVAVFRFPPETRMGPNSTVTMKIEVSQNKRRQNPCSSPSSMQPCMSPLKENWKCKLAGAQKSHSRCCLLAYVWKNPKYTLAECRMVWAADAKVLHKPPSDFLWKDLERFRTSLNCATILCEPSGQAVAWCTPLYWNRRQGWVAKEQSENIENMVIPTFSTTKQKEGWEKEQEFTITDTEWKRADPRQTGKKRQSFIKREKKTSASLFPNQSAWCQSPNSPTHPHFSLVRPLTMGNDGSSLCRQSRCQSSRPDPVPGTLYAGTSWKKNPSVPSCASGEGRRRPTRSAGLAAADQLIRQQQIHHIVCNNLSGRYIHKQFPHTFYEPNFGGVMYVGSLPPAGTALQKYFVTPSYSSMLQTRRLL